MNSPSDSAASAAVPHIIPRPEHIVSRSQISRNALKVLYTLREGGYQAFLVGGCVRDLLLGITPKDFDVATDARPEEVRKLFRNCRLVGRRFRLAHVFFGRETIEVATFRASSAPSQGEEPVSEEDEDAEEVLATAVGLGLDDDDEEDVDDAADAEGGEDEDEADEDGGPDAWTGAAAAAAAQASEPVQKEHREERGGRRDRRDRRGHEFDQDSTERTFDETGRILSDNVYGNINDDVWRRDFTANSLYYNIADFSIWDYVGGAQDIAARTLKLIGDPETRYREDPVRMLRAARFEAKLGFTIDPATAEPIARLGDLMSGVPAARLFDETLKLFLTGHGERSYEVLKARGLLGTLLPTVDAWVRKHPDSLVEKLLVQGLRNTDARVVADKPVTPTFLFALLLYGPIAGIIEAMPPQQWHEMGAILDACDRALREAQERVSIPRRFSLGLREMFALQPRLEHPRGRRALRVLEHPRFRAAYDLMLLRAQFGMASQQTVDWWTHLQEVSPQERERLADELAPGEKSGSASRTGARRGPRRRRRRPKSS